MLKIAVKSTISKVFPGFHALTHARGMRKRFKKLYAKRQGLNKKRLYGESAPYILSGPFKGMIYLDETVWGPIEPKWVGSYEHPLHDRINYIVSHDYKIIVDIGSAEGYYSVGLAWKKPNSKVFSFDTDPWARRQQLRLAEMNNVRNLSIGGFCSASRLNDLIDNTSSLVVCDIEGAEFDLLSLNKVPQLRSSDLLVEIHHIPGSGISYESAISQLKDRFLSTHEVESIRDRSEEKTKLYQTLKAVFGDEKSLSQGLCEGRDYEQSWLWCKTRSEF